MTPRYRARLCSGAVSLGLVVLPLMTPSGMDATTTVTHLAALGDSYASGVGTRDYYPESGACQRSPRAYPVLASRRIGAQLAFAACSGASVGSVEAHQLGVLSAETNAVTVTVGGNDVGFSQVMSACALPFWASNCNAAIDHAQQLMTMVLPAGLRTLYGDISRRAPNADVIVVGYPRLFDGQDCNAGTFFSGSEETRLNASADLLDRVIATQARAAGFGFVDPRSAFAGHAICDRPEWLNGLSYPLDESFHPDVAGQAGYAALVARRL